MVKFLVYNDLADEKEATFFTLIVLLLVCDWMCSVSLHSGPIGWYMVCDCSTVSSYSLAFSSEV